MAVDADGDFVVVWESYGSAGTDSSDGSVQGQRYASDGSVLGGQFQVNSYTTSRQRGSSVAVDADGDFVVVWYSYGSAGTDSSDGSVQGQRYASDGSALGGQFQVNSYTTSFQFSPSVAVDANGDFVVVWQSDGSAGTDSFYTSIQGQRYASDGSPLGGEFQVNSYTAYNQRFSVVAVDAFGDFVVVWQSYDAGGTDSDFSIQGQRYASDGSPLGGEFQVNSYTTSYQSSASVAVDADGDFVVVWESYGSAESSNESVQGQRYASDGSAIGGQFQVNSYTTYDQYDPVVAVDADGDFVVVWESYGSAGTDSSRASVQGQRYQSGCTTGTTLCLNGDRFTVEVDWRDFSGNIGDAQVVPVDSADSGIFWFFAPDNWEMLVKVLNGCSITNHFWVFAAATTNVEYTLRVTDTETGTVMEYFNPLGNAAAAITDTSAFATCP